MGFEPSYPYAKPLARKLLTWGKFPDLPAGVTIHYTADDSLERSITTLKLAGLGYHILIDYDGTCYQAAPFTDRVYHAGKALWLGNKPNSTHIAISLISWGKLSHGKSWRGDIIPEYEIAERQGGQWHKATVNQETSLMDLLQWLVQQGIDPRHICGHDECALPPGRKVDPGGVLQLSMSEVRKLFNVSSLSASLR